MLPASERPSEPQRPRESTPPTTVAAADAPEWPALSDEDRRRNRVHAGLAPWWPLDTVNPSSDPKWESRLEYDAS